jgi:CheY-like chemotaxis protein
LSRLLQINANDPRGRSEPRVLIADDEEIIADTLETILSQNGFKTAAVYDGKAAVEKARHWKPDVFLCDVVMPEMDGVEAAIQVRRIHPGCRILLFSGQAVVHELLREARQRGHDFELLVKPIHPIELLALLRFED